MQGTSASCYKGLEALICFPAINYACRFSHNMQIQC
jgi:hypothetical protein